MSYEEGLALVNGIEGVDVIWIEQDGSLKHTKNIVFAKK